MNPDLSGSVDHLFLSPPRELCNLPRSCGILGVAPNSPLHQLHLHQRMGAAHREVCGWDQARGRGSGQRGAPTASGLEIRASQCAVGSPDLSYLRPGQASDDVWFLSLGSGHRLTGQGREGEGRRQDDFRTDVPGEDCVSTNQHLDHRWEITF